MKSHQYRWPASINHLFYGLDIDKQVLYELLTPMILALRLKIFLTNYLLTNNAKFQVHFTLLEI
jgi:hypothetical protein